MSNDLVIPFQLGDGTLRGRMVRLGPALDDILRKHDYPEPVARLLAETLAVGTALAAMLKFAGKFSLQAKGDGAIKLLVADMTHDGNVRAYAQFDAKEVARMGNEGIGLLGSGFLAFTVEPPAGSNQQSYQGIVELRGKDIAAAAQHYFRHSEQIPTGVIGAASRDGMGNWHSGCILMQEVPEEGGLSLTQPDGTPDDAWRRAMLLLSTCTPDELTNPQLAAEDLLYRLFHEEGVRAEAPRPLRHACSCATRIPATFRLFNRDEINDMAENGVVNMTCQFCSTHYRYSLAEIDRMLAS